MKNRRKNTRAAAKPQEPIRKWIDFALVRILFLIRKLYLESNKRQCAVHLCAGQDRPAHGICKRSGDRCGSTGKPQRFQQILADTGYKEELEAEGEIEFQTRMENIEELMNKAVSYSEDAAGSDFRGTAGRKEQA